jgi:hypothetical protein
MQDLTPYLRFPTEYCLSGSLRRHHLFARSVRAQPTGIHVAKGDILVAQPASLKLTTTSVTESVAVSFPMRYLIASQRRR